MRLKLANTVLPNLNHKNSLGASLKTRIICLASPLIPLHWRGIKGAFLEMPLVLCRRIRNRTIKAHQRKTGINILAAAALVAVNSQGIFTV